MKQTDYLPRPQNTSASVCGLAQVCPPVRGRPDESTRGGSLARGDT